MNKNTDAVPAGVAALYADIIAHPAEEWKASGSELPYLAWIEEQKATKRVFKARAYISEYVGCTCVHVSESSDLKKFTTKAAAEKFIKELEDFA